MSEIIRINRVTKTLIKSETEDRQGFQILLAECPQRVESCDSFACFSLKRLKSSSGNFKYIFFSSF